jgi:hypothetical protein
MNELLELALSAHGGLERWRRIKSIDVSLIISGQLLRGEGLPGASTYEGNHRRRSALNGHGAL